MITQVLLLRFKLRYLMGYVNGDTLSMCVYEKNSKLFISILYIFIDNNIIYKKRKRGRIQFYVKVGASNVLRSRDLSLIEFDDTIDLGGLMTQ